MALLDMIQDISDEIGLTRPIAIVSSTDQTVRTVLALANREGKILAKRWAWQAMVKTATWTTLAAQSQGTVETLAPGFAYMLNETQWLRGQRRPMGGPISAQGWEQLLGTTALGPYPSYRILADQFQMQPIPAAGVSAAFEYVSRNWCQSNASVGQSKWASDTDTGILSEDLMGLGIQWRFKKSKGFAYDEDFRDYEEQVTAAISREGGRRTLTLDGNYGDYNPKNSILVPDGNWTP